jgi:hypothetical protein
MEEESYIQNSHSTIRGNKVEEHEDARVLFLNSPEPVLDSQLLLSHIENIPPPAPAKQSLYFPDAMKRQIKSSRSRYALHLMEFGLVDGDTSLGIIEGDELKIPMIWEAVEQ